MNGLVFLLFFRINGFHQGIICNLKRIRVIGAQVTSLSYQLSSPIKSLNYSELLAEIDEQDLIKAYSIIHELYKTVSKYVDKWLQYQVN